MGRNPESFRGSPGIFFVASMPSLLPLVISLVAWSSTSLLIVAAEVSRLILFPVECTRVSVIKWFERTHVRYYRLKFRSHDFAGIFSQIAKIKFPELRPEILLQRMHDRIAGDDCTAKPPFLGMLYQTFLPGIVYDVKAYLGESVAFALFCSQDVIMRLMLEAMRAQLGGEMLTQKLHAVSLIGFPPHSHPNQMNVIWHQAIGRGKEPFACRSVEHDFAEVSVE